MDSTIHPILFGRQRRSSAPPDTGSETHGQLTAPGAGAGLLPDPNHEQPPEPKLPYGNGAMPLAASSCIARSVLVRCANPIPRSTFGALENWISS